jgi:hypothetical protein
MGSGRRDLQVKVPTAAVFPKKFRTCCLQRIPVLIARPERWFERDAETMYKGFNAFSWGPRSVFIIFSCVLRVPMN